MLKIQDVSLLRYHDHVVEFCEWAQCHRLPFKSENQADKTMATYFKHLRDDARPSADAGYTLFGFICLRIDSNKPEKHMMCRSRSALNA